MQIISVTSLLYLLIPVVFIGYFYFRWVGDKFEILYVSFRMLFQLMLIGYLLAYLFAIETTFVSLVVIVVIISVASFITLRNILLKTPKVYRAVFISIFIAGSINLILVIFFVLKLDSLAEPRFVIPLAGMLYVSCMDSVSLVAGKA